LTPSEPARHKPAITRGAPPPHPHHGVTLTGRSTSAAGRHQLRAGQHRADQYHRRRLGERPNRDGVNMVGPSSTACSWTSLRAAAGDIALVEPALPTASVAPPTLLMQQAARCSTLARVRLNGLRLWPCDRLWLLVGAGASSTPGSGEADNEDLGQGPGRVVGAVPGEARPDLGTVGFFEQRVAASEEVIELRRPFGLPDYLIRVQVPEPRPTDAGSPPDCSSIRHRPGRLLRHHWSRRALDPPPPGCTGTAQLEDVLSSAEAVGATAPTAPS
jgi:hypothetical protein